MSNFFDLTQKVANSVIWGGRTSSVSKLNLPMIIVN
jgi:hypothetical protein